jgi:hypothetical protein
MIEAAFAPLPDIDILLYTPTSSLLQHGHARTTLEGGTVAFWVGVHQRGQTGPTPTGTGMDGLRPRTRQPHQASDRKWPRVRLAR